VLRVVAARGDPLWARVESGPSPLSVVIALVPRIFSDDTATYGKDRGPSPLSVVIALVVMVFSTCRCVVGKDTRAACEGQDKVDGECGRTVWVCAMKRVAG
jgi:hypothetical protein